MIESLLPFLTDWAGVFVDPQKRLFWGYLLCALVIAIVYLRWRRRSSWSATVNAVFSRDAWISPSARADYALMFLNSALMLVLSPRLLGKAVVATALFYWLHGVFSGRPLMTGVLPDWAVAAAFTLTLFVFDDLARYWFHRWMHTIPFLWVFHKVHHSAEALNPITVYRTHPIEGVVFTLRSALVQGCVIATGVFFFGSQVTLVTVLGANALKFAFNVAGSNLRHSPVAISYWPWLERVLMSPAQHHIHHSVAPEHLDKNFGVALSIWDWWFGTLHISTAGQPYRYGLTGERETRSPHNLVKLYWNPFVDLFQQVFPWGRNQNSQRASQPQ